jgi:flagellar basal-body rod protein FlgC
MSIFTSLEVSGSALSAERQRAEVVAANMANAETTHTPEGGPYRRKQVVFSSSPANPFRMLLVNSGAGEAANLNTSAVRITKVVEDPTPPIMRYEPGNTDANSEGYVAYPNINPVQEMADLMDSVRAYQLNAAAISASKQIITGAIDILK